MGSKVNSETRVRSKAQKHSLVYPGRNIEAGPSPTHLVAQLDERGSSLIHYHSPIMHIAYSLSCFLHVNTCDNLHPIHFIHPSSRTLASLKSPLTYFCIYHPLHQIYFIHSLHVSVPLRARISERYLTSVINYKWSITPQHTVLQHSYS